MMRRPTGFDADPRRRQLLKELNNLPPPQLLAQHRLLGRIHTMQLKNTLGRVHSNADKIVHGRPPLSEIYNDLILAHRCRWGPSTPTATGVACCRRRLPKRPTEKSRRMGPGLRRDDGRKCICAVVFTM